MERADLTHLRCAERGCISTWRDTLLNCAGEEQPPIWRCPHHIPRVENHHFPGQRYPRKAMIERATELRTQAEWFLSHVSMD